MRFDACDCDLLGREYMLSVPIALICGKEDPNGYYTRKWQVSILMIRLAGANVVIMEGCST